LGVRGVEFVEDLDEGGFPIGHEDAEFGANAIFSRARRSMVRRKL
jgi:hypothetical protein